MENTHWLWSCHPQNQLLKLQSLDCIHLQQFIWLLVPVLYESLIPLPPYAEGTAMGRSEEHTFFFHFAMGKSVICMRFPSERET